MLIPLAELVRRHGVRASPVLHIGAHVGEEAADYAACGFAPVFWVEGNQAVIPALREAVAAYLDQVVIYALLADRQREVILHLASNGQSSSILPLGTHAREHPDITYVGERSMLTTTVDALADHNLIGAAPFLNIDVQGIELDVLKGAERYLAGVRTIYAEVNVDELYVGCSRLPDMDAWLAERGFRRRATVLTRHGWGDGLWVRAG